MCGPSSQLQALNKTVTGILGSAQNEAKTIFGSASTVFNNLVGGLQRIVNGSPSQTGFSTAEVNAKNAAAVQGGATMARNLGGATAASTAAIGGGNAVTPAGGTEAAVLAAKTAAATETAQAENQVVQQNYERGNENFWKATGEEKQLPGMFGTAVGAEGEVNTAAKNAVSTQQEIDKQNNWWQPMVTSAIGGAAKVGLGMLTGGGSLAAEGAFDAIKAAKSRKAASQGLDEGEDTADTGSTDTQS
jgi:hypothetical protein